MAQAYATPSASFDLRGRQGFVERTIRGLASRARWASVSLIAVVAVAAYVARDYVVIFAAGPRTVTAAELLSLPREDRAAKPWVRVTGLQARELAKKESGRRSSAVYYTIHQGQPDSGHIVLISGKPGSPSEATGWITDIPGIITNDSPRAINRNPRDYVVIETRWTEAYLPAGLGLLLALVFLVLAAWQWLRASRLLNPQTSKPLLALMRFGALQDTLPVINVDLGSGSAKHMGPVILGTDHIAIRAGGMLDVMRISQTVWAYIEVVQHSYNGIPTGKSYKTVLADEHGYMASATLSKSRAEDLIQAVLLRNPAILANFSEELLALWNRNPLATAMAIKHRNQAPRPA